MSWPRRHELIDVDLDAYADEPSAAVAESQPEPPAEAERISILDAADLARIPVQELLPKLSP